jgi:predicted nucleotidyltransferase
LLNAGALCSVDACEAWLEQEEGIAISQQVGIIGRVFVDGLQRILGEKLHGVYIYGAAAFPDALPTGDIDFHVILNGELTDSERSELEALHASLAERFPPLGGEMDGYYIRLDDARHEAPPRSQMWRRAIDDSWALHREHIRAGRHLVLHGPDPTGIYPPASWPEIERALYGELNYVEKHLHEYPDYCILNLCRLIYSFETKDVVVSKAQAADWAWDAMPHWRRHVERAKKSYAGQATPEDRQFMLAEVGRFLEYARERMEHARHNGATEQQVAR